MEADSLRVERQLSGANDPASAVAEPSAGTAEVEQMQETDVQRGMAENRAAALLLSDRENGMVHTGTEKVTESDQMLSVSPVLLPYSQWG